MNLKFCKHKYIKIIIKTWTHVFYTTILYMLLYYKCSITIMQSREPLRFDQRDLIVQRSTVQNFMLHDVWFQILQYSDFFL